MYVEYLALCGYSMLTTIIVTISVSVVLINSNCNTYFPQKGYTCERACLWIYLQMQLRVSRVID